MLRMKYVWTLLLVVVFATMASSMAFAQWIQLEYTPSVTPTSLPEARAWSSDTYNDVEGGVQPFWGTIEELTVTATVAKADGVVGGFGDGSYQPTWNVNRAAMAIFIARAAGITAPVSGAVFPDVPEGYWADNEIQACLDNDIVAGFDDGLYRPTQLVTRAQMSVFVVKATGGTSTAYTAGFDDMDDTHWASGYIQTLVDDDIVSGYPDNFFRPERLVNRGEMSVFIWRSLVGDVVLNTAFGTTVGAAADIIPAEGTSDLYLPGDITTTDAAGADLAPGVTVHVVLDAVAVGTGSIVFELDDSAGNVDTETEPVAGPYITEVDANGGVAYLVAAYTIESGLGPEDYTVTITLPNGAVLDAGGFNVP
jgi:hypothetical protein